MALTNAPLTAPLTVALSPDRIPCTVGVPLRVAVVVLSYTLFAADSPLIVSGAAVMSAVIAVLMPAIT